jgi:hypothetical protein
MEEQPEGLAEKLVAVSRFETAWMRRAASAKGRLGFPGRGRLADAGVELTPEAVQQFVARHRGETREEFDRSLNS